MKALSIIVEADLKKGFYRHVDPPPQHAVHSRRALELTLLRQRHTRSATELESPSRLSAEEYVAERILATFNGDWRHPFMEHYCIGLCCQGGNVSVCRDNMLSLLSCVLVDSLADKVPSSHRWYTIGPTLEAQCLGLLLHKILRRVSEQCGGSYNQRAEVEQNAPEGSQEAFKTYRAKKDRRSQKFLGSIEADVTLTLACIASEPVDHVTSRLQTLDHSGI
jgi:hypothetical protein